MHKMKAVNMNMTMKIGEEVLIENDEHIKMVRLGTAALDQSIEVSLSQYIPNQQLSNLNALLNAPINIESKLSTDDPFNDQNEDIVG